MPEQSNILLIMTDQMIPMLNGAYGHAVGKTPNLDRLVTEGIRFDSAYALCPICAPARAALMMRGGTQARTHSWQRRKP
jgi:choline-sulfatase